MRGTIEGLSSPHPLGEMLPGIYQGDDFAQRFSAGLDEIVAAVFSTLDNLPAYFDPQLAPIDFLDFLSAWVGVEFEASWSTHRRRQVIAHAVELHRRRGTVRGIRAAVALMTDAAVEVRESGGSHWSTSPGSDLPGDPSPSLVVGIDVDDLSDLWRRRVDALVAAVKPAHVPHSIEVGPVMEAEGKDHTGVPAEVDPGSHVVGEVPVETGGWTKEAQVEAPGVKDAAVERSSAEAAQDGTSEESSPEAGEMTHADSAGSTDSLADNEDGGVGDD